jgi:ComF family protein
MSPWGVSREEEALSNFLGNALDSFRRGAIDVARRALPQRCELCAGTSGSEVLCRGCARSLPRLGPACPVCALPNPGGEVCGQCIADPPAFDATIAAYAYSFPVDRLMHAFKYHGRLALAEWGAHAIGVARGRWSGSVPQRLVAVPLAQARQRERGYNQAFEIARVLAHERRIPLIRAGVHRHRAALPQAALPWDERAKNVRGAFGCDLDLAGLTIAVVDDVMTTGASLAELAQTLKKAGAARVENWVVARTLPPGSN